MELRGFSRQVPRIMAIPRQMPRLWPRHVAAVLSVANSVVPTMATHGNSRKLPWQFPRPSAAIATVTRQSPRTSAEVRGNCYGSFRGRSIEATFTAIRGYPRPLLRRSSDTRQLPPKYVGVRCYCRSTCRGSVRGKLRRTNHATAVWARGRESCRGSCCGCFRGPIHGCPRTFPQTSPWVFP